MESIFFVLFINPILNVHTESMPVKPFRANRPNVITYPSDEYSSSDLPQLATATTEANRIDLVSDESYEESYYSYSSEKDWKSKNPTPVARIIPVAPSPQPPINRSSVGRPTPGRTRPMPQSRPTPSKRSPAPSAVATPAPRQPSTKAPAEIGDEYEYSYGDSINAEQPNNQIPAEKVNHNYEDAQRRSPVSNEQSQQVVQPAQPVQQMQQTQQVQQVQPQPNPEPIPQSMPQPSPQYGMAHNDQSQNPIHLGPQLESSSQMANDDGEQTFQIVYEQKNFQTFWKRHVQMTQNDILVYACESLKKKEYGKIHVICTKNPVELNSQYYVGMVVRHQSGSRFTLYGKSSDIGLPNPQLAGISFINLKENSSIRSFRVALPVEGHTYTAIDKQNDLSRIASRGEPVQVPNVKIYQSALPVKKEDGSLTLYFGPYSIMRSTKNFVVRDDKNSPIFTIFKTFDGICTLKVRPPFTPLIGFAIAVAISTSTK